MTDIDQIRMASVMLSHEARIHRFGWDEPPQLFLVYDTAEAATDRRLRAYRVSDRNFQVTTRVSGYAAKAFITTWPADPTLCLQSMALSLAGVAPVPHVAAPLMEMLRLPGVLGVGLASEVWVKPQVGREVVDANLYRNVRIRNMPGAREERHVWLMDFTGRLHILIRTRGGRPEVHSSPQQAHGAHVTPLKMIAAAVTDTLPPREEWPLYYPTLTDLFQPVGSPLREEAPTSGVGGDGQS